MPSDSLAIGGLWVNAHSITAIIVPLRKAAYRPACLSYISLAIFCALLVSCQCSDSVNRHAVALKCIIQFRFVTEAFSLYSDIDRFLPLLLDHEET